MVRLCREVLDFISACEAIHGKLAQSEKLTSDELGIVALAANDLLNKLIAPSTVSSGE
jgi:hypothetical protein